MFDKKSSYALNKKDPDAIVYTDADRRIIRLTREDFDTEADFLKWKAWSEETTTTQKRATMWRATTLHHWTRGPELPMGRRSSSSSGLRSRHGSSTPLKR